MDESELKHHLLALAELLKDAMKRTSEIEAAIFAIIETQRQVYPLWGQKYNENLRRPDQSIAAKRAQHDHAMLERVNEVIVRLRE
jgi:hypothetical protein